MQYLYFTFSCRCDPCLGQGYVIEYKTNMCLACMTRLSAAMAQGCHGRDLSHDRALSWHDQALSCHDQTLGYHDQTLSCLDQGVVPRRKLREKIILTLS